MVTLSNANVPARTADVKRQGRQAETFSKQPEAGTFGAVIFGRAGAPLSEVGEALAASWKKSTNPPLDILRLSPEAAKEAPERILEGLFSESLFGGASLVMTSIARETEARPFLDALKQIDESSEPPAGRLLVMAGDLSTRSTLRKTVEGLSKSTTLQIFERTERDFENWVKDWLANARLALEAEAEIHLIQTLLEDQSLARTELEKLALYADDLDRKLTVADVKSLVSLEDQSSGFEMVDMALSGQTKPLAAQLETQLQDGSTNAIPVLIGLINQFKRVLRAHEISASGVNGAKIGERLTPRIFERQWPAFERIMGSWPPDRALTMMSRIEEVDVSCRQAASPQEAHVRRLLLEVSAHAERQKRRR